MARPAVTRFAIDQAILALDPTAEIPPRTLGYSKFLCPFHGETVPSASIDWDNERLKCFACSIGGSAIDVVMAVKEVDFGTALAFCKEEIGTSGQALSRPTRRRRTSLF